MTIVYVKDVLTEFTVIIQFVKFRTENVDIKNASQPGQSFFVDDEKIKIQIETNQKINAHEISEVFQKSPQFILCQTILRFPLK